MTRIPPDVVSDEQLTALAAKAEAATNGPWFVVSLPWLDEDVPPYINAGSPDPHHDGFVCDMENMATSEARLNAEADAAYIAAASPDVVLELVAEVRQLRAAESKFLERLSDVQAELAIRDAVQARRRNLIERERDAARAEMADARRERDEVLHYVGGSRYSDVEDMFGLDLGSRLWRLAASRSSSPATEAVTEPETMRRWCVDGCVDPAAPGPGHSDYSAEQVIDWMREMGGEARYEPAPAEHYRDAYEVDRPARIVIAGPSGPVVMHPGDEAVPGEWIAGEPEAGEPARFREFTVRRPSEIECEHGLTEAHETEPDHWCHGPDLPYETVRPASPEGSTG